MARKSRKNVGLIGLGIIGSRVAAGLRAAGYHVFVWNRTPKAAPNFLGSPAEVAEVCEIIQLFVSDSQAVFQILEMLGDVLTPRHVIVCSATIGAEATVEAARLVEEKGARFLDAPFTGSRGAADRSQLVYYVGGDETIFSRVKPVLEASSKGIVRCGKIGNAATLKVVTNMIAAVSTQAMAEALAITRSAGISTDVFATALEQNACRSGTLELKLPKMTAADYDPHFSLKHMFKDVQLGIHLANSLDLEIPTTTVTAGVMYGALNNGWADLDFASIYKIYEGALAQADQARALPDKEQEAPGALLDLDPGPSDDSAAESKKDPPLLEMEIAPPGGSFGETKERTLGEQDSSDETKREPIAQNASEAPSENRDAPKNEGAAGSAASEVTATANNAPAPLAPNSDGQKPGEPTGLDSKSAGAKPEDGKPADARAGDASPEGAKPKEGKANDGNRPAGKPLNRIIRRFFSAAAEK